MTSFGLYWIVFKLILPILFVVGVIYSIPVILGYAIAFLMFPFIMIYCLYQDKARKKRLNEQEQFYHNEDLDAKEELEDLYGILGVNKFSSKEEIKTAYKNKMILNHPDKLAALDPELQRIASERTMAIRNAYERLSMINH
jgi:hypothetical protein